MQAAATGPWTAAAATLPAAAHLSLKADATAAASVRAGPGAAYPRVGSLAVGAPTRYEIAGRDASPATWWQIQYSARVQGWVRADRGQTHGAVSGVPVTWVLQAVRGLTATAAGTRALTVTWQAPTGGPAPTGYDVRYRPPGAAGWTLHAAPGTGTTATLPGLTPATAYRVRVRAQADGPWQEATGTTAAAPELRLKATATQAAVVRAGPGATHARVATLAVGSATWYAIAGKDAATAGWWQIRYSATVTGWVPAGSVQTRGHTAEAAVTWVLQAVRGLTATAAGTRALTATWQAPAGGIPPTGYAVQYRKQGAAGWTARAHAGTGTTATLPNLTPATAYDVQVQATQGAAGGPWAATTGTTAAAPQLRLKAAARAALPVRAGPGASHAQVGSLARGAATWYAIVGKDAAMAGWWQIQYSATVTGWVPAGSVQTRGHTAGALVTWVLQAVRGLTATAASARALTATWQAPAGGIPPTGYAVQYRKQGASGWTARAHAGTGTTATIPNLTSATTYEVQVQAAQGAVGGPWQATTGSTGAQPQLSLASATPNGATVRSGPGTSHGRVGFLAGGSTTWYAILGKDAATAGWWQIRFSATVTGWVHAAYVRTRGYTQGALVTWVLQAVRGLAATAAGGRALTATWQAPAGGPAPTGYAVEYRVRGTSAWQAHAHAGTGTTATIPALTPATTYDVQVQARQGATGGPWEATTGTTATVPQVSLKSTTALGLNVRSGPGTSHSRVGSIAGGSTTKYDVLGKDAATAGWWQIRFSATVTGWVHAAYVQTHGRVSGVAVTWTLQAVRALTGAAHGARQVRVTWQAPASGPAPTGYAVQYRRSAVTRWETHAQAGTGTTATIPALTPSAAYTVQVQATRGATGGPWEATTATTGAQPQLRVARTQRRGATVRSGPGTSHARVGFLGQVQGGTPPWHDILGQDAATAGWWQIQYSASVKGWVRASEAETQGSLTALPVTWTLQAVRGLAVAASGATGLTARWQAPASGPAPAGYDVQYRRRGARSWSNRAHAGTGTQAALSGLTARTTYDVRVRATRGTADGPWAEARGATARAATPAPGPQLSLKSTTVLGLNVRSGPGTSHSRVGAIAGGSTRKYAITGKNAATATWWQIQYSATVKGWVHADYVQTHGSTANVQVTWTAPAPQLSLKSTTTLGLNVRSGPGTNHRILGSIAGGSTRKYAITGKNAATATWWQIQYSATVKGWVHADYVQTHGSTANVPVR